MKHSKQILSLCALVLALFFIVSCSARNGESAGPDEIYQGNLNHWYNGGGETHVSQVYDGDNSLNHEGPGPVDSVTQPSEVIENPFVDASKEPISTFSSDIDTASYTLFRKMVNSGYNLSTLRATTSGGSLFRTEEMVNYFTYDCPSPDGRLFGVKTTVAKNPYNRSTYLLKLTLATEKVEPSTQNNLVFLIDVSGSMYSSDKLPLLKKAFTALTEQLDNDDIVSIVTYSGKEEVVLDGCPGAQKERILSAVNSLTAQGVTNGEAGLKMAYQLAEKHYLPEGNNRIFLASDGDLNVGISSAAELKAFVEGKRNAGVFLSVMGFGTGNYRDNTMETLADNGNGVYYYIDGETEAEKIFGEDIFKSLYTVAKDVKLQISFNPELVSRYRLIGYENRLLNKEDFLDDTKDAGELGAGAQITVFYELILTDNPADGDFADLSVRYKAPEGEVSMEEHHRITQDSWALDEAPDDDFLFASCVVECSLLLKDSAFKGEASFTHLLSVLDDLDLSNDFYKEQFKDLVNTLAKSS